MLVAKDSLANPGHQSNPGIINLGMARGGILHVDLLSELCQLSTVGFSLESLVRSECISLHVKSRDERPACRQSQTRILSSIPKDLSGDFPRAIRIHRI